MRMRVTPRSVASYLTLAIVTILIVTACSSSADGEPNFPVSQRGNNLSVTVWASQIRDEIYYQDNDGAIYVVRPSAPDLKLAVIQTTVRNDRSNTVIMDVNEESFTVLDADGSQYDPVNPFVQRQLAPNPPQTEPYYNFIWGNFELPNGFGVTAWTIFELPDGVKPTQLRWTAVDTVFVRFFPFGS